MKLFTLYSEDRHLVNIFNTEKEAQKYNKKYLGNKGIIKKTRANTL